MRKTGSKSKMNKYLRVMGNKVKDISKFESPVALYEWFVRDWRGPLRGDALRDAYLAAWAFSIDRGLVEL